MVKKLKPTLEEKKEIQNIQESPMSNVDISKYFPNVKIISYHDLKNFDSIFQLLPKNKSFFILLYETKPNFGHWTLLMRYDDTIEYFDSLGKEPDEPLSWLSKEQNNKLGIYEPYLTNLLKKSKMPVIYNPIVYQKTKEDINTCGRHVILRIKQMLKNKGLQEYFKILYMLQKKTGLDFDKIVSSLITAKDGQNPL
jgi:hypothetical protein